MNSVTRNSSNGISEGVAIIGGTLIDGNGGTPLENSVVIIDGKRIVGVGDRSLPIPPHVQQITAGGKFIVPGLMSAYAFLADGIRATTLIRYDGRYDEVAIEAAQIALKGGLTSVFDIWGPRDFLMKARDAIREGQVTAATIYLAGNIVGYDGPLSQDFQPQNRALVPEAFATRIDSQWQHNVGQELIWKSPEQVRRQIQAYARSGIDFLSLAFTDHRPGVFQYLVFSPRVQQVIIEEARRAELSVIGFCPMTEEALVLAVNAGVDLTMIALNIELSPETVALLAQRQIPCGIFPNTSKALAWCRQKAATHPNPYYRSCEIADLNERALIKAGVPTLLTTGNSVLSADYLNSANWKDVIPPEKGFGAFGESHFYWLRAMQDKRMNAMTALLAATRNVARAYRVDRDVGTLERGKVADLLILDRNPLDDAENYRSIILVMKEGRIINVDALPIRRLITAPSQESS